MWRAASPISTPFDGIGLDIGDAVKWGGDKNKIVLMGAGAGGHLAALLSSNPSLASDQGATIWADCLVILRDSPHHALAHEFINFLLDSRIAARRSSSIGRSSPA